MPRALLGSLAAVGVVLAGCLGPGEAADTDAPFVAITSPQAGATVSGLVIFSAQALDGHGIAKVRFLVDGELIGEDTTEPYAVNWNTLSAGNGARSLRAEAVDVSGNTGFTSISVTVDNSRN